MEEDITTELCVLQSHLDGILDRVYHNSLTLKRLQAFEMRLLGLNSLAEMIEFILGETKDLFDLDIVSLCLLDSKDDISTCLANDNYQFQTRAGLLLAKEEALFKQRFDFAHRPLLGIYHAENYGKFFDLQSPSPSSVILAPLIRRGKYLGSLNLGSYRPDRFICNMATDFIEHLASVLSVCLENILTFETMRRTSLVDPLTGVNNRRFLEQRIEEELDRSQRSRDPLSCLFLDIDFFKRINDGHGHQAGDHVLASVAGAIKKQLRSNDVLSRYGGEEFVALLSQSDQVRAGEIAERIRMAISALSIQFNQRDIPVTLSIGTATFLPMAGKIQVAEIAGQLIQTADAALYQAKHNGRNRVESGGSIDVAWIDKDC
ncbi:sensor domain-containing diguanylate cyclase [Methylomonas sp. LL1]|uniref:sensor domain-containing diguanylate cyclase n=1 Tax=Methylomonas sp. LL1 TaxID=2785785 RepID=UPI0018C36D7C|nr:sensor domain-containing diguanylate cyclase [Methylomonas sp. LL1]QPK64906.1 sensor domain-containing diguanylate cyclase [Methylomonas sp. LL1]